MDVISDKQAEDILAKSTGQRVTKQAIESRITDVAYMVIPDTTVTICHIVLDNGFSVRGESACVDPSNFNKELGEKYSYENAFEKLWQFFGFLLAEQRLLPFDKESNDWAGYLTRYLIENALCISSKGDDVFGAISLALRNYKAKVLDDFDLQTAGVKSGSSSDAV